MNSIVDILNKYFIIEPAICTDLSDVQLQNSLKGMKGRSAPCMIRVSRLSREEKLRMVENVDISIFKRYTCLVCLKSFVQKKRDGRLRLVRHLREAHEVSSDACQSTSSSALPASSFTDKGPTKDLYSISPNSKSDSDLPLSRTFDDIFRNDTLNPPILLKFAEQDETHKFTEHICKLIWRFNVPALFFGNELFKEGLGELLVTGLPHLPNLILERMVESTNRIEALIASQKYVALSLDYFDYGQVPVQLIMVHFLDSNLAVTKRLISFKAVSDDQSKVKVFKDAITHWKLELKILSVTSTNLGQSELPRMLPKRTVLERLFSLEIPSFNELAKALVEVLFQQDLSSCEIRKGDIVRQEDTNSLRALVSRLKLAVNYVKENATRESYWRNSLELECGWSAKDTDILLWNGAQWTEFCEILARVPQFINPLNDFLLSQHRKDLALKDSEIEALALLLNLTRPLCSWCHDFASDTVQIHNYFIHIKKVRLLLAYMSMCELFDSRVPEASRTFEDFVERLESDKPLYKFLQAAYLLGGCFSPYDDEALTELKRDFVDILSEDAEYLSANPQAEVDSFFAHISSSRKPATLPEEFWRTEKENFPSLFKVARVVLTVRPVTLSLTANTGKYVLNHLRSPRHLSRSEGLLITAMEDDS